MPALSSSAADVSISKGNTCLNNSLTQEIIWAKDDLNSGSITPAQENEGYDLVTYYDGMTWNVGDIVILGTIGAGNQIFEQNGNEVMAGIMLQAA